MLIIANLYQLSTVFNSISSVIQVQTSNFLLNDLNFGDMCIHIYVY